METLSVLLTLCEGNPPVTGGFPSLRASYAELWNFFYCAWTNTRVQLLLVIWEAMLLTWRHSKVFFPQLRSGSWRQSSTCWRRKWGGGVKYAVFGMSVALSFPAITKCFAPNAHRSNVLCVVSGGSHLKTTWPWNTEPVAATWPNTVSGTTEAYRFHPTHGLSLTRRTTEVTLGSYVPHWSIADHKSMGHDVSWGNFGQPMVWPTSILQL